MPTLDREAPVMAGRGFLCAEQTHSAARAESSARTLVLMIEGLFDTRHPFHKLEQRLPIRAHLCGTALLLLRTEP